jgi:SAM-dependent methyltransferase
MRGRGFLEALAAEAARRAGPIGKLGRELSALHAGFTGERGSRPADYFRGAKERRAYLVSIGVPNAARALHAYERTGTGLGPGDRALDAGSGPGPSALALASRSHPESEIHLLDRSAAALREAESLFAALFPDGPRVVVLEGDVTERLPEGRFSVVTAGHLLNELLPRRGRDPGEALATARKLARALSPGGRLFLLEPAQRIPARALSRIREALIAKGLRPLAPCPHAGACPVLAPRARDWCVVDVAWDRPPPVREADRLLGTDRSRLRLSFLALARGAEPPAGTTVEVLSEPMRMGKAWGLYLCTGSGRLVLRTSRRPRKPLPRGSWLRLPEDAKPAGRDRSGAPRIDLDPDRLPRVTGG